MKSRRRFPGDIGAAAVGRAGLQVAQAAQQIRIEPLTDALCLQSTTLPNEFHRDPADRLIVALARKPNAELVTADNRILSYREVKALAAE